MIEQAWQMKRPPRASDRDREAVARGHSPREYVEVDGVHEPVRLQTPICYKCGEPWEEHGCSTMRVLGSLALNEYRRDENDAWLEHARRALAVAGVRGYWERRAAQGGVLAIEMRFTAEVLNRGGMECIDEKYSDMRKEIKAAIVPPEDPMLTIARDLNRVAADRARAGSEPFRGFLLGECP